jgi:hypothetical protein
MISSTLLAKSGNGLLMALRFAVLGADQRGDLPSFGFHLVMRLAVDSPPLTPADKLFQGNGHGHCQAESEGNVLKDH